MVISNAIKYPLVGIFIQTKHGFDDTQIELLENRMNEFQNEITNSKPMMKKLEEEKQVRETKIIQIEQEVEKDSVKEIQLRELEDQKEELLSYAKETIKKIQRRSYREFTFQRPLLTY